MLLEVGSFAVVQEIVEWRYDRGFVDEFKQCSK